MASAEGTSYVAECFWPGVQQDDLRCLVRRIGASVAELDGLVRYTGSMLIVDDEVVLCLFETSEGQADAVRRAMEHAGVPFERILRGIRAPWPETT